MMLKKITAAVLLFAVLLSLCLGSCASSGGNTAMTLTYGDNTTTFSSNIYSYYMSYTKTMMLSQLYMNQGITDPSQMGDMPDLWKISISDSVTYADMAKIQAEETLKQFLAIVAYCKDNNLQLSKEKLNEIDSAMKTLINESYGKSKGAFNATLARFGIDDTIFKEIKKYELMSGLVYDDLFNTDTGKRKITEEIAQSYYEQNCARVKHILILYSPGTKDVDGNDIEFTEEEMAERMARIDDLYDRINNGEDFDSLLGESEDPGTEAYPDGYTVSRTTNFVPEFLEAAFDMEIGEVRKVESDYGMHIMKRYELISPVDALDINTGGSWAGVVSDAVRRIIIEEELAPYIEKIEIDTNETLLFNIASSDTMFDCTELMG